MPLANGQTIAGYTVVRLIGSGGMGEVYLAQHPRLPRQDAFKVLHTEAAQDSDFRERFVREADLAASLTHPNIVPVYDRGEIDGQLWISSQYIEGTDAAQMLEEHYPHGMPAELVADIVTGIASALDFANSRGLLHRDVKPANILLSGAVGDGARHVYLADFGIARTLAEPNGLTATGMTVGTFAYSAPEQLLGEDVDGRADQYALAATAYQLLTGARLFPNSNVAVVINHQINTAPPKLADTHPDLARLDPVFQVALAKRPGDRFRRCSDLARALAEQIGSPAAIGPADPTMAAPTPARGDGPTRQPASTLPRPGRSRRRAMVAAAALGAILIGGALVAWSPWRQAPATAPQEITATPPPPNSKETLETRAHQLDLLASQGDAAAAYNFYSQRCKNIIGDLDSYKAVLTEWLRGRSPQYSNNVTAKVNGSSAQVVSIDSDPNAPANAMTPRTWTFIDGQWQFDNC